MSWSRQRETAAAATSSDSHVHLGAVRGDTAGPMEPPASSAPPPSGPQGGVMERAPSGYHLGTLLLCAEARARARWPEVWPAHLPWRYLDPGTVLCFQVYGQRVETSFVAGASQRIIK